MKNIISLKEDVSSIEQQAINGIVALVVIRLGLNSKTYLTKEGHRYGAYIEVNEFVFVFI